MKLHVTTQKGRKCVENAWKIAVTYWYSICILNVQNEKNKLFLREKQVVFPVKTTCMRHQRSVDVTCVDLSLKG